MAGTGGRRDHAVAVTGYWRERSSLGVIARSVSIVAVALGFVIGMYGLDYLNSP